MSFPLGLTWDDVALMPQYNNVKSRTEPDLSTWLTKDIHIGMPLIPANMDTVIGTELAQVITDNGGVPIFHRFTTMEQKIDWLQKFPDCFMSAGLNEDNIIDISKLVDNYNLQGVVLDVAHGHSKMMLDMIFNLKKRYSDLQVIAGNVCGAMAYQDLVNAGADAVKVGIGPGAACTTRVVTGFGVPQFTAIKQCADIAKKLRVPIIADGGIRGSRDVVLALAAGASTVMIGKLFALTEESAAEKKLEGYYSNAFQEIRDTGQRLAKYRGQASEDFQNEYYGGLKEKTVAEGTNFWAPVSGPAQTLIDEILGGLRSGLTYGGARSIKELQRKAEFMRVTSNYGFESNPRR